ncbi:MAG: histone-like protein [Promethearchaeota archaeon]
MAKKQSKKSSKPVSKPKAAPKAAPKVASSGESSYIAKAPIRRLMKNQGADLVAENAVLVLINALTGYAQDLTKKSIELATKRKAKKITQDDIVEAAKLL